MKDTFKREINYLRVSVTDRCNLRCLYCMPESGIKQVNSQEILSFEEFLKIIKCSAEMGIKKIRITGGEPLVRLGLVDFIKSLRQIEGLDDIALTTNGILLTQYAKSLKEAGLNRVNISLDTLKPDRFKEITRLGNLEEVFKGIDAALEHGLEPVKLNMVVMKGFNEDEILDFARLTVDRPLHVRYIELMPIGESDQWAGWRRMDISEIKEELRKVGKLVPLKKKMDGSGPAKYYSLPGAKGTIGFISAMSSHFCGECNRLRLTAEGNLRPCLHSKVEYDLKSLLRSGASDEEITRRIEEVVLAKPNRHSMEEGWKDNERIMSQIGG